MAHASSFGTVAAAYAEHRPDYARGAVGWALDIAPGSRVLDLGAGTGKLTGVLLGAGPEVSPEMSPEISPDSSAAFSAEVTAVEPDAAMLAELGATYPAVTALHGSAESIPLSDGAVDAVLAGNALHWFDPGAAGAEIARVLAPGGVLAGLWNLVDDDVPWVAGLERVAGPAVIGPRDTRRRWRAAIALATERFEDRFAGFEYAEFPHAQRRTADSLVETLSTRHGVVVMPEPERTATRERIRTFLAEQPETAEGEFDLPMLTGVLRMRRGDIGGTMSA